MNQDMNAGYFLARSVVDAQSGCWVWAGHIRPDGYARTSYRGRGIEVHRLAYQALVGELIPGLHIDHLCHTRDLSCPGGFACHHRACLNPDHLEQVTRAENNRRAKERTTHCPQGHPYAGDNLLDYGYGRACRTCVYARNRRQPRRKPAPCLSCGKATVVLGQVCHSCTDKQEGAA